MMQRRFFLAGIIAAATAPAIVRSSSLMPVRASRPSSLEIQPLAMPDAWADFLRLHDELYRHQIEKFGALGGYTVPPALAAELARRLCLHAEDRMVYGDPTSPLVPRGFLPSVE